MSISIDASNLSGNIVNYMKGPIPKMASTVKNAQIHTEKKKKLN